VRALSGQARLVVLDEPTASLPEPDAQHLFEILRRLRRAGTGIVYVTHRLNELFGFADRITVLRDGRHVRTAATSEMTPNGLVQDMLGRPVEILHAPHVAAGRARPVVAVVDLRIQGIGPLGFEVAAGEIVGLVGLRGAGHEMIGRAIFGAMRPHAGEIRLDGAVLPNDDGIPERIAKGIALLAGDRGRESALPGMSVQENLLPNPGIVGAAPWRLASPGGERRRTAATLDRLDVRPADPAALIEWLSGGNQQKVFVGRWLESKARLFVMEEPTAGVDIGAKFAIHALLRDVADKGAAILVVSSDFEEVATLCDRALVISRGVITSELHGAGLTVDTVLARASLGAGHVAAG
jgi:ribose transport system ATP-binding protein